MGSDYAAAARTKGLGSAAFAGNEAARLFPIVSGEHSRHAATIAAASAGNPLLLSLDRLVARGYLSQQDIARRPRVPQAHVGQHSVDAVRDSLRVAASRESPHGDLQLLHHVAEIIASLGFGWIMNTLLGNNRLPEASINQQAQRSRRL